MRIGLVLLLPALALAQGPPRPPPDNISGSPPTPPVCCPKKMVDSDIYTFLEFSFETKEFGCLDPCVYLLEGTDRKFCFAPGTDNVKCVREEGTPATGATAPPTPTSGSTAAPSTAGPTNAPPTGSTAAPGSIDCQAGCSYTIKFDQSWGQETNYERTADVLVPATSSAKLPVVIDLHGSGGLASTNRLGKFLKNSIIVAGQGYERQWNIVKEKTKAPDTDYVKEVIRQIGEIQQADMDDVTIFGTSNGAGMIYRLLIEVEAPRPFHKVIPAVSTMTDDQYKDGTFYTPSNQNNTDDNDYDQAIVPGKPGPEVHYFHGTADRTVPYEAGKSLGVNFIGAQEATYALAQAFGYEGAQLADAAGVTVQSGVTKYEYSTPDNSVIHYKMTDMGHNAFDALYSDFIQDYIKTVVEG